jgi:hypothetical protein
MTTLINLTAILTEAPFTPIGHQFSVGEQLAPGVSRAMRLCPAGLQLTNGSASVCIPAAELWKLAETHEPALARLGDPSALP